MRIFIEHLVLNLLMIELLMFGFYWDNGYCLCFIEAYLFHINLTSTTIQPDFTVLHNAEETFDLILLVVTN